MTDENLPDNGDCAPPRSLVQRATMAWDEAKDSEESKERQALERDRREVEAIMQRQYDVTPFDIDWIDGLVGRTWGLVFRGFPRHRSNMNPPGRYLVVEWKRSDGSEWLTADTVSALGRLLDMGSIKVRRFGP